MADGQEESSPTEILDFWMTFAIRNPTQHGRVAQEVSKLLRTAGTCHKSVRIVLDFYEHLHPLPFNSVTRHLVGLELFKDILQPALDPFMSQLLFESVTTSSTECVEYCVQIWLERVQNQETAQHLTFNDQPNPLEFLAPQSPTRKAAIPASLLLQFKCVDSKQRQICIKMFRFLFDSLPAKFYSRAAIAFFIFLEFYKQNVCENASELLKELMLWMETCVLLITAGLLKSSTEDSASLADVTVQKRLSLQHTLSALLLSTKALKFLKVHSDIQKKLAKALERLQSCSSGATRKWLQFLRSEIESDENFSQV